MRQPDLKLGEWQFYRVLLEDKAVYTNFIEQTRWPINLWSANFPFIWAYSKSSGRQLLWRIVDDMLVTFILKNRKLSLFCLPFGQGDVDRLIDVLQKCFRYCHNWNRAKGFKPRIRAINSAQLEYLQTSKRFNQLFYTKQVGGMEIHYSIERLVELKGKQFDSLRRTVNRYYRQYPDIKIRPYQSKDYRRVLAFNRLWQETSGQKYPSIIDRSYFKQIVKRHHSLDLAILVAELKDDIVGLNIGGALPNHEAWGCICKTDKKITGLNEAIILELIRKLHKDNPKIKYINVGSDMGNKGLKHFKEKFRPALKFNRYKVFLKEFSKIFSNNGISNLP